MWKMGSGANEDEGYLCLKSNNSNTVKMLLFLSGEIRVLHFLPKASHRLGQASSDKVILLVLQNDGK